MDVSLVILRGRELPLQDSCDTSLTGLVGPVREVRLDVSVLGQSQVDLESLVEVHTVPVESEIRVTKPVFDGLAFSVVLLTGDQESLRLFDLFVS